MFYVYEWYDLKTNEVFYVGKGCGKRVNCTKKRNKLFKEYIKNNICSNRVVKYFENEDEAFKYEKELILLYRNKKQCSCNLDDGGKGGCHFVWNDKMKSYISKYNPMKDDKQKERMSKSNPMKNKKIAKKNGNSHKKPVIIQTKYFSSVKEASIFFGVCDTEITHWCKRGYDRDKKPCRYANEIQKEFKIKITNSKKIIVGNKIFNSVKEGAKYLNVWSETLIRNIKKGKKCKGYEVKYAN